MSSKRGVFISYCRSDGTDVAANLRKRLSQEHPEIPLWQDVVSERGGRDWWVQISEALDSAEYMVLIMTPDATKSETVRKEWRYARQKGVCVYPVKGSEKLDFSRLPSWMRDKHFYDIGTQWEKFILDLNVRCEAHRVPFMVDDLPENFVPRSHEFDQLIDHLRDPKREGPIAITAALQGAGGYGKTTLARALCHDERIQEAFDDGILWVTLGQNPGDLTFKLVELIEVLSGERPGFKEEAAALARLRELLADRDILLVVDDVWNAAHLTPFLSGGSRCSRLITTRNLDTLPGKTKRVIVDAMRIDEAVNLLGAGLMTERSESNLLRDLATRLGEWPVLLRLVNAAMRERVLINGQSVARAIEYVNKALARRGLEAFNARNPVARDQAVDKTIGLSLELLTQQEHELYVQLAIFPEDVDIPLTTIEKLWSATGGLDEFDTEDLCARLFRLSLLVHFELTKRQVRLHDVMKKYLNTQLHAPTTLHGTLIKAWGNAYQLPDGYAWRFLAYHLVQAGDNEQLSNLLLDFNWIRAKLEATDIYELIADYEFVVGYDKDCELIQGALRLSIYVLSKDKTQLAGQLVGRLLNPGQVSRTQNVLAAAAGWKGCAWLRPIQRTLTSPGGLLVVNLEGHIGLVLAVTISEKADIIASGSADNSVKIWNLRIGNLLRTLKGHTGPVRGVAISPDRSRIVSASEDKTLKIWDLSGNLLDTLMGHSGFVYAVSITRDDRIVSASADRTLIVWDLRTGKQICVLKGHDNSVNAVAISPDGTRAISSSLDQTLRVWDLTTGAQVRSWKISSWVNALAIVSGQNQILLAGHDGTLTLWSLESGKRVRRLIGHTSPVYGVAVTPDGKEAVSASADQTLCAWDLNTGCLTRTLVGHTGSVYAVAISPDGTHAVSAAADRKLKVWNLKGHAPIDREELTNAISWVKITPDGIHAVSTFSHSSTHSALQVWRLQTGEMLGVVQGKHTYSREGIAVTSDGRNVVGVLGGLDELAIWDVATGSLHHTCKRYEQEVGMVRIGLEDRIAIVASGTILEIWDLQEGTLLRRLSGHSGNISDVVVTEDNTRIISASSWDHTVMIWDLQTGKLLHILENRFKPFDHMGILRNRPRAAERGDPADLRRALSKVSKKLQVLSLAAKTEAIGWMSDHPPQPRTLLVRDGSCSIFAFKETMEIWDLRTAKMSRSLTGNFEKISEVTFESGAAHCLVRCDDAISMWDLRSGNEVSRFSAGPAKNYNDISLASHGRHAAYVTAGGTLTLYDAMRAKQVATFTADASLVSCDITPDGHTVVAGDNLGNVHFLRLE